MVDKVQSLQEIDRTHGVPSVFADDGPFGVLLVEPSGVHDAFVGFDALPVGEEVDAECDKAMLGQVQAVGGTDRPVAWRVDRASAGQPDDGALARAPGRAVQADDGRGRFGLGGVGYQQPSGNAVGRVVGLSLETHVVPGDPVLVCDRLHGGFQVGHFVGEIT